MAEEERLKVDHILYVVSDFAAAVDRFRRQYGLDAYEGGAHDVWGTGNWIIPLGPSYIELLGIVDDEKAARHPIGRWVQQEIIEGDHLAAWSLTVGDVDSISRRLGTGIISGSRTLPNGSAIRGQMTGLLSMLRGSTSLPFFIAWDTPPESFPGAQDALHLVNPLGVGRVDVGGDEQALWEWIDNDVSVANPVGGAEGVRSVIINTDDGEILIR